MTNKSSEIFGSNSPITRAPIASGIPDTDQYDVSTYFQPMGCTQATTSSTSFGNIVNYTGAGVLEFAAMKIVGTSPVGNMRITIDGNIVYDGTVAGNSYGKIIVGAGALFGTTLYGISLSSIPFYSSILIQHKVNSGTGVTLTSNTKFRKVA